jgi:hypothetical protein
VIYTILIRGLQVLPDAVKQASSSSLSFTSFAQVILVDHHSRQRVYFTLGALVAVHRSAQ